MALRFLNRVDPGTRDLTIMYYTGFMCDFKCNNLMYESIGGAY